MQCAYPNLLELGPWDHFSKLVKVKVKVCLWVKVAEIATVLGAQSAHSTVPVEHLCGKQFWAVLTHVSTLSGVAHRC